VVDLALLLLRGLLALVFVLHGTQKLLPGIGGSSPEREARRFEAAGIRPAREYCPRGSWRSLPGCCNSARGRWCSSGF
jgi:uncharacterized membrane protein YphA (DoxX/SURF4 family)